MIRILFLIFFLISDLNAGQGRFVNPITDVCWKCLFPITIGGIKVASGSEDTPNPKKLICFCKRSGIPVPIPGISISFWEPVRLIDITRTPYNLVCMGGLQLGSTGVRGAGTVEHSHGGGLKKGFYQAHWYIYPVVYWLELLTDFACMERASFDVGFITELDPTWNDEEWSFLSSAEAVIFANPIAQVACAADCVYANTGFPSDKMFWCAGCQGSIYPFSGSIPAQTGGVQASLLITHKLISKLHRWILADITSSEDTALCDKHKSLVIKKSQYKTQIVYPIPTMACHLLGRSEVIWGSGREFPYKGEDFGYLIWRKRNCCLL